MERSEILKQIRRRIRPGLVETFCFLCGSPGTQAIAGEAGEEFLCPAGHRHPRAFLLDGKAVTSWEREEMVHESAGAIVRRDGQLLLFSRRKYPPGWTIPAGHVEEGRDPEEEMRREVLEETGLVVNRATRLWPGEKPLLLDACRRGADYHRWNLFDVEAEGEPRLDDEGKEWRWCDPAEVRALAARRLLISPVEQLFRRLGMVD